MALNLQVSRIVLAVIIFKRPIPANKIIDGKNLLIFCKYGKNESVAVVMVLLMKLLKLTSSEALKMVLKAQPVITLHERLRDALAIIDGGSGDSTETAKTEKTNDENIQNEENIAQ